MNQAHLQFLASPEWAQMLETDLLPWIERADGLGDHVLEVGPGPGLTTDLLRRLATRVTAVEIDADLARALAARLAGTNVTVVHGDASETRLQPDLFSSATCFGMLHHVPSKDMQDRVFAELHRLLRPGGTLLAVDSLDLEPIRLFHQDDVFLPLDPNSVGARLEAAGFINPILELAQFEFRVWAVKRP
jgi:SAM-dependent methyltransferase